ncbi:helix-turn-helix domain-containing protein [Limosilactobacillus reuteri]|uniref:helix-turn-helix domain-containing protein n=1 Tax=Limosilactobacillus reuteri TaxID=1598 RepID=UPI001E350D29|nr:helix-turn-helix domain-containing protein [Limosilactobacillus reuteri]
MGTTILSFEDRVVIETLRYENRSLMGTTILSFEDRVVIETLRYENRSLLASVPTVGPMTLLQK